MRRLIAFVLLCTCAHPQVESTPKIVAVADSSDASTPVPAVKSASPVAKSSPKAALCTADTECGYDDPCMATACVGVEEAHSLVACEESAPRPGRCVCADRWCTLLRNKPETGAATTGCTSDAQCEFLPATGSCVAGTAKPLVTERGGYCTCSAGTCTPQLVETITCVSSLDCSFEDKPRRPASAAKVKRPFPPVLPCKTGTFDSVCVGGRCVIKAWKC